MKKLLLVFAAAAFSLTSSCAGREEVAKLAGQSSAVLNDYRREMGEFASRQTVLIQDNERRVSRLIEMKEETQANVDRATLGWELGGDTAAIGLLKMLSARDANAIFAGNELLQASAPAAVQPVVVKFDAGQVDAVVKQLKALEQAPTFWDNISFAIAYKKELKDAYKASLDKAATEAEAAGQ